LFKGFVTWAGYQPLSQGQKIRTKNWHILLSLSQIHNHVLMTDKSKAILNFNLPKICFVYSYFVTKIKPNNVPEQFSSIKSEME